MSQIIMAMLAMSGRVTMLGLSRWAGIGGSYRTVLRFFHTAIPWATLLWVFFRRHLFCPDDVYLLARQVNLHIISKLRHDSALYMPYEKPESHKRSRRKYGDKLDYRHIPDKYLCQSDIEDEIQTDIYQATSK